MYLSHKPDVYLLVWAYIYARSDDNNVFTGFVPELLSRFKISKTTLFRIIDFGFTRNGTGTQVERKWNDNILIVTILEAGKGTKVKRNRNASGTEKEDIENSSQQEFTEPKEIKIGLRTKTSSQSLYTKMIEVYDKFCYSRTGAGAKIDSLQGKSVKDIISFLSTQIQKKNPNISSQEKLKKDILASWEYILSQWDSVKGYYSDQIKLNQINSNLPNILVHLKKAKTDNRDAKFTSVQDQIGRIDFNETQP